MTRLKSLLLAGTILPALTLTPLAISYAQAPDQGDRHGPRPHEGGGPRAHEGGGPRGEGKGEGHAQKQGGERRQGGPAARENAEGGPKGARAADDTPRGEGKRNGAGGEKERPHRGDAARTGERDNEPRGGRKAADEGPKAAPAGRAAQGRERDDAGARGGAAKENAQTDRAGGERPRAGAREERARDRAEDRQEGAGRRAGERDPDDRTRAGDRERPNDRTRAGERDRPDDRTRAGERDRPNDRPRAGERERPDDRMRAGERDRDERLRPGERPVEREDRRDERRMGGPAGAAGPGFAGGFMAPTQARRLDDVRRDRREVREGDRVFIREPGRTIVQERGRAFIVHDENDRFRALGLNVRREQRGGQIVDVIVRPGGEQILTYTDGSGRMLRRVRRLRDGREVVLIDNAVGGRVGGYAEDVVALPPPPMRIPRERYVVDYRGANANTLYDTLSAPPLAAPPRRYTLDQVRYSPDVRNYVRSVDINTINFDSGSWEVPAAATGKLEALASAINKAVDRNPNSVFLIEGYTDATGNPDDNLSLSDRRAQSVAEIMTKDFKVPPENLTTQGYGQQNPKENTQGPSEANRRVVVRNITQLLASGDEPPPAQ